MKGKVTRRRKEEETEEIKITVAETVLQGSEKRHGDERRETGRKRMKGKGKQ